MTNATATYAATADRASMMRIALAIVRRFEAGDGWTGGPDAVYAHMLALVHEKTDFSDVSDKRLMATVIASVRIARSYSL
jgi:hypothetical protein